MVQKKNIRNVSSVHQPLILSVLNHRKKINKANNKLNDRKLSINRFYSFLTNYPNSTGIAQLYIINSLHKYIPN